MVWVYYLFFLGALTQQKVGGASQEHKKIDSIYS